MNCLKKEFLCSGVKNLLMVRFLTFSTLFIPLIWPYLCGRVVRITMLLTFLLEPNFFESALL